MIDDVTLEKQKVCRALWHRNLLSSFAGSAIVSAVQLPALERRPSDGLDGDDFD